MAASRVGCLAWGSLLWDPRTLPLAEAFRPDGPRLPIEFSRVALDGRVTLVIDARAQPVGTFWAMLAVESIEAGVEALALREGVARAQVGDWIGVETRVGGPGSAGQTPESVRVEIAGWLAQKPLDAVLWTALPSRRPDGRFERPEAAELVDHLERLEGPARARAEQYIRRAPGRLRTPNRHRFESVFGWSPEGEPTRGD